MHSLIERFCQILGLGILVLLFISCGGGGGGFNGGNQAQTNKPATPLSITTSSLADGTVGQTYLQLLEVQGGSSNTKVQWASQGQLPPGLILDPSLGRISGTPTTLGTYPFLVQAQDTQNSSLTSDPKQFSITIKEGTPLVNTPAGLGLGTSQVSVKSDNSDSAKITATVLDKNNANIQGTNVSFSASGGQLSAPNVMTDADGKAVVQFSAGTVNNANQVVTITATAGTLPPRIIPIQIVGNTLKLTATNTSLPADGSQAIDIEVTLLNAGDAPIFGSPVCLQIPSTVGGGNLSFSDPATGNGLATPCSLPSGATGILAGNTDVNGQLHIQARGSSAGQVTLIASSAGAQADQNFEVVDVGQLFKITAPVPNAPPQLIKTGGFTFTVQAPGATAVRLITSFGTWQNGQALIEVPVLNDQAQAILTSNLAGVANVVAQDVNTPTRKDNIQVQFTVNINDAAQLLFDASPRVVPISTSDVQNVSILTATLLTEGGPLGNTQAIANAVVSFTLLDSTGGGETLNPPFAVTDSKGVAHTTFTSGARSSSAIGIPIRAQVVTPNGIVLQKVFNIVITDRAASLVITRATTLGVIEDKFYVLDIGVLVADIDGHPVPNVPVSLSVWPLSYSTGFRQSAAVVITDTFQNEDIDENALCRGCDPNKPGQGEDINGDGRLTPPNAAAGTLPRLVKTDKNGLAFADLIYPKVDADWIVDRIRASTSVSGMEPIAQLIFRLPGLVSDETADPPVLPNSPFNEGCPYTVTSKDLVNVPLGGNGQVMLTLNTLPNAPHAPVNGRPIIIQTNNANINAAGGATNSDGQFTSQITVAAEANVGATAVITYFASCAVARVNVTVVAP